MALIKGKQIAAAPDGVATTNINANAVTAAKVGSDVVVTAGTNAFAANQSMGGFKLTNLATPTVSTDAVTKAYADGLASGLSVKSPVLGMSTTNIASLSGLATTVDTSVVLNTDGMRVLLTGQSTGSQNGIWVVHSGAWTRPTDFDVGSHAAGAFCFVEQGTSHADQGWVCTTDPPTDVVNTDSLAFVQFSSSTSLTYRNGLTSSGGFVDVVPADAALSATSGSLAINYTAVGALTAVDAAAASAGTAASLAHGDHKHTVNTGTPVNVGTANAAGSATTLPKSDHVHATIVPVTGNKRMTASVTTADGDSATATTMVKANGLSGYVEAYVNGVLYHVGDGVKTTECYISGDGGTTARAFSAIAAGDTIRWNGSIAGFQLAATDMIDIVHSAF
jgi:hypothetical protein